MRLALLYPPPWQMSSPGLDPSALDGDAQTAPYGLLSLAAQAIRAGHEVACYNLAIHPWQEIVRLIRQLDVPLFGLSALSFNRHGMAALAQLIRTEHPRAHIVVGGHHATALTLEILEHHPAIDTVVFGEGENTFLELIRYLENGMSPVGIAGTAWRDQGRAVLGEPRPRIENLDQLASTHDYFSSHLILTSRGCPWQCTYCASEVMWGRRVHTHSVDYVLDEIRQEVLKHRRPVLSIKDDTFTAHRKRALRLCQAIREENLNFVWSCDTRVDAVDEELLFAMRQAGCQRISFGMESGSETILASIGKKITVAKSRHAIQLAKKFGFEVRTYFMVGNRHENLDHFRQTFDLIQDLQPHGVAMGWLSIYPGTREFDLLAEQGLVTGEDFFRKETQDIFARGDITPAQAREINAWLDEVNHAISLWSYGVEEYRAVLGLFPDLAAAHLDMAGILIRAQRIEEAMPHLEQARTLNHPLPGLIENYYACVRAFQGEYQQAWDHLEQAMTLGNHRVVLENRQALQNFLANRQGETLHMMAHNYFEEATLARQPVFPAALNPGFYTRTGWIPLVAPGPGYSVSWPVSKWSWQSGWTH